MALRPNKPCRAKGCQVLTRAAGGYCDEHADQAKAWATRQGSGRGGRPWRRTREEVLKRDSYLCQCEDCKRLGRVRPAHEVDHVVPLAQGGTDSLSNLAAINHDCHRVKTLRESAAGRKSAV